MKPGQSGGAVQLLVEVAAVLVDQRIDYAVIGAMAAAVHGIVRASLDADALISVSTAQLEALGRIFRKAGLETSLRKGDADDPIPALLAVTDGHGNRVDLLGGLRGLDPLAFARTIEVSFRKQSLRVIGREDFIAMKCFAGGPQDLDDARLALAVSDGTLDISLLRRLTKRFGKSAARNLETLV